jgi:hypothetical protein
LHSLISFLPLISIIFDCRLSKFSAATANPRTQLNSNSSCARSLLYNLGADPQKTPLPLLLCVDSLLQKCLSHSCIATSAAQTHSECHLERLFYCCMMSQHTWRVLLHVYRALPSNGCFCLHSSCFEQICHSIIKKCISPNHYVSYNTVG